MPMMNINEIKLKITQLSKQHDSPTADEIWVAELIEEEAEGLIVTYCEHHKYTINGFPTEKRKLFENQETIEGVDEDEYFCQERFQLYLNHLTLEKDDVAELCWHYTNSFWPNCYNTKEEFLDGTREILENGHYDIVL